MTVIGVDTGGTFTDFLVFSDGQAPRTHKVLSTPDAPERAILQGLRELGLDEALSRGEARIIHGSTVATNAALEGKTVPTAFITNRGFADLLTIGRQTRPSLYALEMPMPKPPVPADLCLECGGRVDAQGNIIEPLDTQDIQALVASLRQSRPAAVAINLLFSFLEPGPECQLEQALKNALGEDVFICRSSEILPEYREYERGIATWLNASLGPLVAHYLARLRAGTAPARLAVMQSSGGTIDADLAARRAVNLLLSGPAGGLAAARFIARGIGEEQLITFDMGGTSTDVALIDGDLQLTTEGYIGSYPVAVPMVDMHTIGAGGGSIAHVDGGGLLQVGPTSAGANPGPACYGLGGTCATVTDANLVLGRLLPASFMGGRMRLDVEASRQAVATLAAELGLSIEESAAGIIRIANEHMVRALRVISVERGHDPARFRLCSFGGAGGLHICRLAEALNMRRALVPVHAGVLSALGMTLAPVARQLSQTHRMRLDQMDADSLEQVLAQMRAEAMDQLADEVPERDAITLQVSADLRYLGQSSSLTLAWAGAVDTEQAFHALHAARYGHRLRAPVEMITLRVSAQAPGAEPALPALSNTAVARPTGTSRVYGHDLAVPVYDRQTLALGQVLNGPALITEDTATTFLESGWQACRDEPGNLLLTRTA